MDAPPIVVRYGPYSPNLQWPDTPQGRDEVQHPMGSIERRRTRLRGCPQGIGFGGATWCVKGRGGVKQDHFACILICWAGKTVIHCTESRLQQQNQNGKFFPSLPFASIADQRIPPDDLVIALSTGIRTRLDITERHLSVNPYVKHSRTARQSLCTFIEITYDTTMGSTTCA